jgi:hypothetical protein
MDGDADLLKLWAKTIPPGADWDLLASNRLTQAE